MNAVGPVIQQLQEYAKVHLGFEETAEKIIAFVTASEDFGKYQSAYQSLRRYIVSQLADSSKFEENLKVYDRDADIFNARCEEEPDAGATEKLSRALNICLKSFRSEGGKIEKMIGEVLDIAKSLNK